jgi:hypothetical protein
MEARPFANLDSSTTFRACRSPVETRSDDPQSILHGSKVYRRLVSLIRALPVNIHVVGSWWLWLFFKHKKNVACGACRSEQQVFLRNHCLNLIFFIYFFSFYSLRFILVLADLVPLYAKSIITIIKWSSTFKIGI